jgi:hypothetical protein
MIKRLRGPVGALATVLSLVAVGCGDDDSESTTRTAGSAGVSEYVGAVSGADTKTDSDQAVAGQFFVAVTIDGGEVVAYACDSVNPGELFRGKLEGDEIELESESGNATLRATVSDGSVEGELTANGKSQPFESSLAEGIGGLYTLTPDGTQVTGQSVRGNRFDVTYDTKTYDYEGTFTTAEGDVQPANGDFRNAESAAGGYDEYRAVVLDTGVSRGIRTATAKPVRGTNWIDPDIDP